MKKWETEMRNGNDIEPGKARVYEPKTIVPCCEESWR